MSLFVQIGCVCNHKFIYQKFELKVTLFYICKKFSFVESPLIGRRRDKSVA